MGCDCCHRETAPAYSTFRGYGQVRLWWYLQTPSNQGHARNCNGESPRHPLLRFSVESRPVSGFNCAIDLEWVLAWDIWVLIELFAV